MEKRLYDEFAGIEKRHWWFVARRDILKTFIKRFGPKNIQEALDVGSGPGINAKMIKTFADKVTCLEPWIEAVEVAKKEAPECTVLHGSLPGYHFDKKFDLITLFDVLEHIEQDEMVLDNLKKLLKEEGRVILTVPAYKFLWSEHDTLAHHMRRYTKKELVTKAKAAGFDIKFVSYFNFFLFFPIAVVRIIKNMLGLKTAVSDFSVTPGFSNTVLREVFRLEKYVLPYISLPFGVSIICVLSHKA